MKGRAIRQQRSMGGSAMYIKREPEAWEKLNLLVSGAALDREGEIEIRSKLPCGLSDLPVYYAATQGRRVPILKTLLTSACERDCAYCPFRAGRDARRTTLRPAELARLTSIAYRGGIVQGILLSSGIAGGGIVTQDRLLKAAHLLRRKYKFRGYLHLKLMPGAEKEQILQAMRLADRVSVNLEAPGSAYLTRLAPRKDFWKELFHTLATAEEIRRTYDPRDFGRTRWPSLVTQFVVGAAGERDIDLLHWSERLVRQLHLARVYYSPFRPIPQTPLEHVPPERLARTKRLYRAFYLLRDYGFRADELPWDSNGNLLPGDPKVLWAKRHLTEAPVEINTAPREDLLRVPGIGPKRAEIILQARQVERLRNLSQLRALGLPVEQMAPYILLDGRRPARQLSLF